MAVAAEEVDARLDHERVAVGGRILQELDIVRIGADAVQSFRGSGAMLAVAAAQFLRRQPGEKHADLRVLDAEPIFGGQVVEAPGGGNEPGIGVVEARGVGDAEQQEQEVRDGHAAGELEPGRGGFAAHKDRKSVV